MKTCLNGIHAWSLYPQVTIVFANLTQWIRTA